MFLFIEGCERKAASSVMCCKEPSAPWQKIVITFKVTLSISGCGCFKPVADFEAIYVCAGGANAT